MTKDEALAKYKAVFLQILHAAQRARSINAENYGDDDIGAKMLEPHVYDDDDPLNIVTVITMYLERFESGLINKSDIFNGLALTRRLDIVVLNFEIGATMFGYKFRDFPHPLDAMKELIAAGVE